MHIMQYICNIATARYNDNIPLVPHQPCQNTCHIARNNVSIERDAPTPAHQGIVPLRMSGDRTIKLYTDHEGNYSCIFHYPVSIKHWNGLNMFSFDRDSSSQYGDYGVRGGIEVHKLLKSKLFSSHDSLFCYINIYLLPPKERTCKFLNLF